MAEKEKVAPVTLMYVIIALILFVIILAIFYLMRQRFLK